MDGGPALAGKPAIRLADVSKRYRMSGDLREKVLDALGLSRLLRAGKDRRPTEFEALRDVSFEVPRGRRYGLIGRNGAGKTTLLKLISGNFAPTAGRIEVNGSVQALMTLGQGFHPDYSGRDNISSSLQYNGLSRAQFRTAIDDIIEFCELGQFIDQPFKTYSSGMQARLMFATATAIRPDILIVDEVLGAGDAYFVAKSRRRVDTLVGAGCTLLLVSHSMGQVLELCDQVIWLDSGRIRQMGDAFPVVKAYEEWISNSIDHLDPIVAGQKSGAHGPQTGAASHEVEQAEKHLQAEAKAVASTPAMVAPSANHPNLQVPAFLPHAAPTDLALVDDESSRSMAELAPGGISRWPGKPGLRIVGVTIAGPQGPTDRLMALQPAAFSIFLEAGVGGPFRCRYGIIIHDLTGRTRTRIWSPADRFVAAKGDGRRIDIILNPNQLGPGTYTLGISILGETELELVNSAPRYDLLGRSFLFHVDLADSLSVISAEFFHSAEWRMRGCSLAPDSDTTVTESRTIDDPRQSV
jgi:lipopolysaccharide transport system ATP-binding protein